MSPPQDWTPDRNDPAFDAGQAHMNGSYGRADGAEGTSPWFHAWIIRQAFWAGVRFAREQAGIEPGGIFVPIEQREL